MKIILIDDEPLILEELIYSRLLYRIFPKTATQIRNFHTFCSFYFLIFENNN